MDAHFQLFKELHEGALNESRLFDVLSHSPNDIDEICFLQDEAPFLDQKSSKKSTSTTMPALLRLSKPFLEQMP